MRHLHFGAGKFGLGFAGWLSKHLNLEFCLANRANRTTGTFSPRNKLLARNLSYQVRYPDYINPHYEFVNFDVEDDKQKLMRWVSSIDTKLITISLKGNHACIIDTIITGLLARHRADANKLYLLAFENGISSSDIRTAIAAQTANRFMSEIDAACEFVPCIIDRICN